MKYERAKMSATRREFLASTARLAGGIALACVVATKSSRATPATMEAAIRKVIGEAPLRKGKVMIDVPPLVENGNSVSLSVSVDSPMTAGDHVQSIHVLNEKNPQPNAIGVHLGPRGGQAALPTRIQLAEP